jgi:hypothetical protein
MEASYQGERTGIMWRGGCLSRQLSCRLRCTVDWQDWNDIQRCVAMLPLLLLLLLLQGADAAATNAGHVPGAAEPGPPRHLLR